MEIFVIHEDKGKPLFIVEKWDKPAKQEKMCAKQFAAQIALDFAGDW